MNLVLFAGKGPLAVLAAAAGLCCLAGCGGNSQAPGAGKRWTNYPALTQNTTSYNWLVVKCQLSDVPAIPAGLDTSIQQFLGIAGAGYGNIADYFHDVSYNRAQVMGTRIVGWVPAPFGSKNLGSRQQRVQACLSAIPADQGVSLDEFYGVVVINNAKNDGGACGAGQLSLTVNGKNFNLACLWFDRDSLFTDFAAHEFSHGLGLNHSYDDSGRTCGAGALPSEYCDAFDIMSAMVTYSFADNNWLIQNAASGGGPGMNVPNLMQMGWMPAGSRKDYSLETGGNQKFKLRALSHARPNDALAAVLSAGANAFDNLYTVEYRQGDGWDLGFSTSAKSPASVRSKGGVVLVHQYRGPTLPSSTLINGAFGGALQESNTVVLPGFGGLTYHVTVQSIDIADASAVVEIGTGRGPFLRNFGEVVKDTDRSFHLFR